MGNSDEVLYSFLLCGRPDVLQDWTLGFLDRSWFRFLLLLSFRGFLLHMHRVYLAFFAAIWSP